MMVTNSIKYYSKCGEQKDQSGKLQSLELTTLFRDFIDQSSSISLFEVSEHGKSEGSPTTRIES